MNILYSCDNNYIWLMGISMISLFENNSNVDEITIYLLGENISDENKNLLMGITSEYNQKFIAIDMPQIDIPSKLFSERWPKSAFSRLFAGELLPQSVEKILYIDCDTIVLGGLENLWNTDVSTMCVAGVKDCISKYYRRNIGLADDEIYVNAGVLLCNLKKMREFDMTQNLAAFVRKYGETIHYADQDLLNGIFKGYIVPLTVNYNVTTLITVRSYSDIMQLRKPKNYYSKAEIEKGIQSPSIIHYTTCMLIVRPWYPNTTHPLANEFLKYKEISPWREKNLAIWSTQNNKKVIFLKMIHKLPNGLQKLILGIAHSALVPTVKSLQAGKKITVEKNVIKERVKV